MTKGLSREEVRRVDGIAINELGIPGVVLMENAGRNATEHVVELFNAKRASRVVIFCGPGNNGGDGFVIARHLLNRGHPVFVFLTGDESKLTPDAGTNYRILRNMGVDVPVAGTRDAIAAALAEIRSDDIVVDALLGTGFCGNVREPLATLINGINVAPKAAVLAADVPSGLDCDTGEPCNATIKADVTVTFAANKVGFGSPAAVAYTGVVHLADIGAPPSLVDRL